MILFHLATWGIALLFALRGLARMLAVPAARKLAVADGAPLAGRRPARVLPRPVLQRQPGEAVFDLEKGSFLEEFGKLIDDSADRLE